MADKETTETHKEVSVAEFFEKNRHLLGFNNPAKSLLTSVKEAVDNSLDACEEAKILPDIFVKLEETGTNCFKMIVEDNGPGIVKKHLTKSFGKLLYGSKFQSAGGKQGRGQQGIGISAVILYGQLTTGRPALLISKTKKDKEAHQYIMHIDVKKNEPEIVESSTKQWEPNHGLRVEVEMEGKYVGHKQSVMEYIKETAIVNPHTSIIFITPDNEKLNFPRVTDKLPKKARSIKPHPHGVELGVLKRIIKDTKARSTKSFLTKEFDKVGGGTATEIIRLANATLSPELQIDGKFLPRLLKADQMEALLKGMQSAKVMNPSTDCLSPIGSELLKKSLESEYDIDFVHSITRSPAVYRGNPFQIEVAIAYGGELDKEGAAKLIRFANKVPLLYQEGACVITKAMKDVSWKSYGLSQSGRSMPTGAAIIAVHMASVWVPFTSEGKEAISDYPEILKEVKLALQDCGRTLQKYVRRRERSDIEAKKREVFKAYSVEVAEAIANLTTDDSYKMTKAKLDEKAEKIRKKLLKIAEGMYLSDKEMSEMEQEEAKSEAKEVELEAAREEEEKLVEEAEKGEDNE